MTTHSVAEVLRAAQSLEAGHFRELHPPLEREPGDRGRPAAWPHHGQAVAVAGARGGVGATTLALAIAEVAGPQARLVDTSRMHASGLASATTAELGVTETGWRRGTRANLVIERAASDWPTSRHVPVPEPSDHALTVVDVGRDILDVASGETWLAGMVESAPLLIVASATVPSLRRLDATLTALDRPGPLAVAIVGAPRRRWPRPLAAAITPRIRQIADAGALIVIRPDPDLSWSGISTDPLPASLLRSAETVSTELLHTAKGTRP